MRWGYHTIFNDILNTDQQTFHSYIRMDFVHPTAVEQEREQHFEDKHKAEKKHMSEVGD